MDLTEKKVIKGICKILTESAKSSFKEGDVTVWSNFANRMRTSIINSVQLLEDLVEDTNEQDKGIKL